MIHLPNYNNTETLFFIISPILVGSQLIGGIFLSYTRIKLGFAWSILQHSAFNLIILLFGIFISHNQIITEESNEDFSVKIIEQAYVDKNKAYYKSKFNKDTMPIDINLFRKDKGINTCIFNLFNIRRMSR